MGKISSALSIANKAGKLAGKGLRMIGGGSASAGASRILSATPLGVGGAAAVVKGANKLGSAYKGYIASKQQSGESKTAALRRVVNSTASSARASANHAATAAMSAGRAATALSNGDVAGAHAHIQKATANAAIAHAHATNAVNTAHP